MEINLNMKIELDRSDLIVLIKEFLTEKFPAHNILEVSFETKNEYYGYGPTESSSTVFDKVSVRLSPQQPHVAR